MFPNQPTTQTSTPQNLFSIGGVSTPAVLPNLPASVTPPPKQVTVVTPDMAKTDLATKTSASQGVISAAQQQTQAKLAATAQQAAVANGTQPVISADGTTPPVQPGQQTTGTTTPSNVAPENATKQQILQLINSGDVNLTKDQVSQIAGLDFTGVKQNPDGTYTLDETAKQRVDQQNGYTQSNVQSTGDPTTDYILQQRQQLDANADQAYADYSAKVAQIQNGTFPLTTDQQAQVAQLQSQFDQLKELQKTANSNYTGATTILGIRAGRSQYAPEIAQGEIKQSIDQGIAKLANIDTEAASAVASLKQGFLDKDYTMINDAYGKLQDSIKNKNDTLTTMQNDIKSQIDMETARINQQNTQLDIQTKQINNVAQSALQAALKLDGTLDLDAIQNVADDNGIDANALYGAVLKAQRDETVQQQQDATFASAQLQAGATLAKTKADTAKVYSDLAAASGSGDANSPFINQPGYSKLTTKQKTQADASNNIVNALTDYRQKYNNLVDASGGKAFGQGAATLQSAYNSLIFQVAQAVGTGALQQADREVIEKILPNPTTISGIANAVQTGGKQGGLDKIDSQIENFTNNLTGYGLTPQGTTQGSDKSSTITYQGKQYAVDANGNFDTSKPIN